MDNLRGQLGLVLGQIFLQLLELGQLFSQIELLLLQLVQLVYLALVLLPAFLQFLSELGQLLLLLNLLLLLFEQIAARGLQFQPGLFLVFAHGFQLSLALHHDVLAFVVPRFILILELNESDD